MKNYKYVFDVDYYDDEKCLRLIRIELENGIAVKGEEYYDGKWNPYPGALSFYPDPSPAENIDEKEAFEIIKKIDKDNK